MPREFGPAPINTRCPDCGVYPVDGYMSHLTTCPQRRLSPAARTLRDESIFPMPRMDRDLREGMEIDGPGWLERLASWVAWHWRQVNWDVFWITLLFILAACLIIWFGLEWLESASRR